MAFALEIRKIASALIGPSAPRFVCHMSNSDSQMDPSATLNPWHQGYKYLKSLRILNSKFQVELSSSFGVWIETWKLVKARFSKFLLSQVEFLRVLIKMVWFIHQFLKFFEF